MSARGASFPVALLAVLGMAIMVVGSYALIRMQVRESLYQVRSAQAQAIAEAGLEDALNKVLLTPSWKTGYSNKPFAGGYYVVSVSTDQDPWITSTGYSAVMPILGRAARTVQARALFDGFFNFAATTFTVNWPITAYDSSIDRTPTCRTNNLNANGCKFGAHVLGNISVVTGGSSLRINGDALYAEETSTAPAQATVAGLVTLLASSATVPIEDGSPYLTVNDNDAAHISNFSVAYDTNTMILYVSTRSGNVTISSGTYYFKGLYIVGAGNQNVRLTVDLNNTSQAVNIYLAGNLVTNARGYIDSNCGPCRPYNVHVYGQGGGTMTLTGYTAVNNANSSTQIDLFCPEDDIVINQRFLGRAVGRKVTISNPYGNGNNRPIFFFDTQFGFSQVDGVRWVSGSWSESYYKP